jgi:hypothetical protein
MDNLKVLYKSYFKLSSDAHLTGLGINSNVLSTIFYNYNLFLNIHSENREENLIKLFIEKGKENLNSKQWEELRTFSAQYEVNTDGSKLILSHFLFVALYSFYERALKDTLLKTNLCTLDEYKKMYRHKYLQDFFSDKFNFNYEDWNNDIFNLLEELRCINNCIKHSGFVNKELHKTNKKWLIGDEIKDLSMDFQRFINVPYKYFNILIEKINTLYFGD